MYTNTPLTPSQQAIAGSDRSVKLANHMVANYARRYPRQIDDIRSVAFVGLVLAARDHDCGPSYHAHAHMWIRSQICMERQRIRAQGFNLRGGGGTSKTTKVGYIRRYTFDEVKHGGDYWIRDDVIPPLKTLIDRICIPLNTQESRLVKLVYREGYAIKDAAKQIPSNRADSPHVTYEYARQLHASAMKRIRAMYPKPEMLLS